MDAQQLAAETFAQDWAALEKDIEIDGRKLRYVELGDPQRPTLLFVHGIVGTWRNWIYNLRPFEDRFHVVAIDLPGFGASEMPVAPLDMHVYARAIAELSRRLDLREITLVGNSMGGLVGAVVAKTSPGLLERLVLVDAAGFSTAASWLSRVRLVTALLDPAMRLVHRLHEAIAGKPRLVGALLFWCVAHPFRLAKDVALMLLSGAGRAGFIPAAHSIFATRITAVPGQIDLPTLIVWGRKDHFIPRRDAFNYMRICPDSTVEMIQDAAHLPMLEQPDEFNALLERFVAERSAAPAPAESAA